jgi:hypothetical protein
MSDLLVVPNCQETVLSVTTSRAADNDVPAANYDILLTESASQIMS